MDKKRAEYLRGVALVQQHKAFQRWKHMEGKSWDKDAEAARLECAQWAIAASELYNIAERKDVSIHND